MGAGRIINPVWYIQPITLPIYIEETTPESPTMSMHASYAIPNCIPGFPSEMGGPCTAIANTCTEPRHYDVSQQVLRPHMLVI